MLLFGIIINLQLTFFVYLLSLLKLNHVNEENYSINSIVYLL